MSFSEFKSVDVKVLRVSMSAFMDMMLVAVKTLMEFDSLMEVSYIDS
jgi:hypothetical protein